MKNDNEIDKILSDFKQRHDDSKPRPAPLPIEPPVRRDNTESTEPEALADENDNTDKKARLHRPSLKKFKINDKKKLKKIFVRILIAAAIIAAAAAAAVGIKYTVEYARTAYLKPYQEKYPDAQYPVGILEEYCDDYGRLGDMQGYIEFPGTDIDGTALTSKNITQLEHGAERFNYSVFLESNELEQYYKDAQAYNSSSKELVYSDLFEKYTFQVAGAFYTNSDEKDDDGYIFPYSVTEQMTDKSFSQYFDRLETRMLYTVDGIHLSKKDILLTVSCPTDYSEGYRFVVVAKLVESADTSLTAADREDSHITAAEYRRQGRENPYRFSSKWYPEIIITDDDGNQTTIQKTIDDYKLKS